MSLPTDKKERKACPIGTGFLDYFPDAAAAVAEVSYTGNEQHNPGEALHWDRSKSKDHFDSMIRHSLERGKRDIDGGRHSAKMAWRALALLQEEIENEKETEKCASVSNEITFSRDFRPRSYPPKSRFRFRFWVCFWRNFR